MKDIKQIKCLLNDRPVTCVAADEKYIYYIDDKGQHKFEKPCRFIAYHKRKYDFKFSKKLLMKLPKNEY